MIYQQELTEHNNASMRCGAELTGSTTEQESDSIGNHTIVSGISEGRRIGAVSDRAEFTQRVKAFDKQEQKIAADNLPIEMLNNRLPNFDSELLIGEYVRRTRILEDGFAIMADTIQSIKDALSNSPQDTTHP